MKYPLSPPRVMICFSPGLAMMMLMYTLPSPQVMMAKVDGFLDELKNYDKENIHAECLKAIKPYLADPQFNADFIRSKSLAAAGQDGAGRHVTLGGGGDRVCVGGGTEARVPATLVYCRCGCG